MFHSSTLHNTARPEQVRFTSPSLRQTTFLFRYISQNMDYDRYLASLLIEKDEKEEEGRQLMREAESVRRTVYQLEKVTTILENQLATSNFLLVYTDQRDVIAISLNAIHANIDKLEKEKQVALNGKLTEIEKRLYYHTNSHSSTSSSQ